MSKWNKLQKQLNEWANETFSNIGLAATFDHVIEELEEIEDNPYNSEEWADVLMMIFHRALDYGFSAEDLRKAMKKKFKINKKRKWTKVGTYYKGD